MFFICKCYLEVSAKACKSGRMWFWTHSAESIRASVYQLLITFGMHVFSSSVAFAARSGWWESSLTDCTWLMLDCKKLFGGRARSLSSLLKLIEGLWKSKMNGVSTVSTCTGWSSLQWVCCSGSTFRGRVRMPSWSFEKTFVQSGRTSCAGLTAVIGIVNELYIDSHVAMVLFFRGKALIYIFLLPWNSNVPMSWREICRTRWIPMVDTFSSSSSQLSAVDRHTSETLRDEVL